MDCREFERIIPDFLNENMDFFRTRSFLLHALNCAACKEELSIQFLVREGMASLEEGDAFDLSGQLGRRINRAWKKIRFHEIMLYGGLVVELVMMLSVFVGLCFLLFG